MVLVCKGRPAAIEVREALESGPHREVVLASTLRASVKEVDPTMLTAARQLAATMTAEHTAANTAEIALKTEGQA